MREHMQGRVKLVAIAIAALALVYLGGCTEATEEQATEEPTAEETSPPESTSSIVPVSERREGPLCEGGEVVLERVRNDPGASEDVKQRAIKAIEENPEKNWCRGYVPQADGSIRPYAEIEPDIIRAEHETARKKHQKETGKNEAGQDVSNIPQKKMTPEQGACFRNYFESLPRDQRGKEQQRVTAEANERGITPPEVVGC